MHSKEQMKSALEAAQRYAQAITPEAIKYLEGRGISEQVAARFELGVVSDPAPGHEHHAGWLSIPYITALGLCVGFKFRRLDEGKPKYGSPSSSLPDNRKRSAITPILRNHFITSISKAAPLRLL